LSEAERFDGFPPTPKFQLFQHSATQAQTLIASKRLRPGKHDRPRGNRSQYKWFVRGQRTQEVSRSRCSLGYAKRQPAEHRRSKELPLETAVRRGSSSTRVFSGEVGARPL
jgi:hypothetical protein